ncbi:Inositol-pentakisphosphate 2-kinase [Gracilaria domingensis]|nr:Inositol-pentakisphosphate 2-kinase [Gracilaria domingensis]
MRHLIRRVGEQQATKLVRRALYTVQSVTHHDEITYKTSGQAHQLHSTAEYTKALKAAQALSVAASVQLLAGFLQAAAAKDCSMMIALCRLDEAQPTNSESMLVHVHGVRWRACLWVIDTDEKHIAKILGKWGVDDRKRASMLGSIVSSCSGASQQQTNPT